MNIVVLAGGISTERDVSLISGKGIYRAVKSKGHKAILLDVFLGYEGDDVDRIFDVEKDWEAQVTGIKETNPDLDAIKALRPDWEKNYFGPNVIRLCQMADVVFMALHGENPLHDALVQLQHGLTAAGNALGIFQLLQLHAQLFQPLGIFHCPLFLTNLANQLHHIIMRPKNILWQ